MINKKFEQKEEAVHFLENLPSPNSFEFSREVRKQMGDFSQTFLGMLEAILKDFHHMNEIRFKAFVLLTILHRRLKNHTQLQNLVNMYHNEFMHYDIYYSILSQVYRSFENKDGLKKAIYYGRKAVERLGEHIGVLHHFCETVVSAQEEGIEVSQKDIVDSQLFIDKCITLASHYGKYRCTKGRMLSQQQRFEEAKEFILQAIDLEDHKNTDYSIRMNEYNHYLHQVKYREQFFQMKKEMQEMVKAMDQAQSKIKETANMTKENLEQIKMQNLQILAFFTAIISFIISSITILSRQASFLNAAMLILILSGALMIANVAFGALFVEVRTRKWSYILTLLAGLIMMGLGFYLQVYFEK